MLLHVTFSSGRHCWVIYVSLQFCTDENLEARSYSESGEKLKLLEKRAQGFHELFARMVVDSFVRCDNDARIFRQPLDLFLHDARMMCAAVVAP